MRPKSSGAKASPGERTVAQEALFHTLHITPARYWPGIGGRAAATGDVRIPCV